MGLFATLALRCDLEFLFFFNFFFSSEEGRIKSFSGFLLLDVKDNSVLLVEDLTEVCVYVVFDYHIQVAVRAPPALGSAKPCHSALS